MRSATALRADAAAIGALPPLTLSDRRGDLILAAALRPAPVRHPMRLVAIAALLALLITGSIAVGALLMNRLDDNLSIVVPVPTPTASPDPGLTADPSAVPSASPGPTPTEGPGGTLVVTSEVQQQSWIEVLPPDGSVTRLAQGSNAAWLDADTIVYECSQPSPDFVGICSVDLASPGSPRTIVGAGNRPAPAPDGRSIAFHRGGIDIGSTWIVDADGSNLRELAPGSLLEWSPDGAWLAGQADSAAVEVAIIRPDGSGLRSLAPGHDPAWSPSGDRLVYLYNDEQGEASLRTVDVATGEVTDLWGGSQADLSDPAWLGDRGWVFVRDGDIWRLDVGASRPVPLGNGFEIESGSLSSDPLAVSPDFGWVAYTTGIDTDARVGITSVSGNLGSEYLDEAMSDPRWAPEPGSPAPTPAATAPAPSASAPSASAPIPPPSGTPAPVGEGLLGWTWTETSVPAVPGRPDGVVEAVTARGPGFVAVGRGCLTTVDPATLRGHRLDERRWAHVGARTGVRRHRHRRHARLERPGDRDVRRCRRNAGCRRHRLRRAAGPPGHDLVLARRGDLGADPARPRRSRHGPGGPARGEGEGRDLGRRPVRRGGGGSERLRRHEPGQGQGSGRRLDLARRPELGPRPAHRAP